MLYALINRKYPDHTAIGEALQPFTGRLVTSNFIFDETISLYLYRMGDTVASAAGDGLMNPHVVYMIRLTSRVEQARFVNARTEGFVVTP